MSMRAVLHGSSFPIRKTSGIGVEMLPLKFQGYGYAGISFRYAQSC